MEKANEAITKEAVYAWIYSSDGIERGLYTFLPQKRPKRGVLRARKPLTSIPDRVSIHDRPKDIEKRDQLGHLEGDLFFNSGSLSSNVLTLIDRKSRMIMLTKNCSKRSQMIIDSMENLAKTLGVKSITLDNGSEFTLHGQITKNLGISTYFCDPGAPWQKGSVENVHKRIRRFLPFKVDEAHITQERLDEVADLINNIPLACLGFYTPREIHAGIDVKQKGAAGCR